MEDISEDMERLQAYLTKGNRMQFTTNIKSPLFTETLKQLMGISTSSCSLAMKPDQVYQALESIKDGKDLQDVIETVLESVHESIFIKNDTFVLKAFDGLNAIFKLSCDQYHQIDRFQWVPLERQRQYHDIKRYFLRETINVVKKICEKRLNLMEQYFVYERLYIILSIIREAIFIIIDEESKYERRLNNSEIQMNRQSQMTTQVVEWTVGTVGITD